MAGVVMMRCHGECHVLPWRVSHLLAPVHTIFPELKTRAVVRGSLMRMMTAANLCRRQHLMTHTPHTPTIPHLTPMTHSPQLYLTLPQ